MAELPDVIALLEGTERTEGDLIDGLFRPIVDVVSQLPGGAQPAVLAIAGGAITPATAAVLVDTEGATATDDLTNIVATHHPPGRLLTLMPANPAHVVTIRHLAGGAGEIQLAGGLPCPLTAGSWLSLILIGATWVEESRSAVMLPAPAVADAGKVVRVDDAGGYGLGHPAPVAQCRLEYLSSTSVRLVPRDGDRLVVGGQRRNLPGTLTYSPAWAANTLYYIFAWWTGSAITLELDTTPFTIVAGIPVKSGDPTRTLVGMVYTNGSSQIADTPAWRGVASYWNRRRRALVTEAASFGTGSSNFVNVFSPDLVFLSWGGLAEIAWSGHGSVAGTSSFQTRAVVDGSEAISPQAVYCFYGSVPYPFARRAVGEWALGPHAVNLQAKIDGSTVTLDNTRFEVTTEI